MNRNIKCNWILRLTLSEVKWNLSGKFEEAYNVSRSMVIESGCISKKGPTEKLIESRATRCTIYNEKLSQTITHTDRGL